MRIVLVKFIDSILSCTLLLICFDTSIKLACIFFRTIMALWRARALTPEQKVQIADEEFEANTAVEEEALDSEAKNIRAEETGLFMGIEDVNMSLVYSSILSLPVSIHLSIYLSFPLISFL